MKTTIKNGCRTFLFVLLVITSVRSYAGNGQSAFTSFHHLSYDSVKILISNFLMVEDNLRYHAEHHALGGYITKNAFSPPSSHNAVKFYPCYDEIFWFFHDQVSLAYMTADVQSDEVKQCRLDAEATLNMSSDKFKYNLTHYDVNAVNDFISNQSGDLNNEKPETRRGDDVIEYSLRFIQEFSENGVPSNVYQCGGMNKNEFDELLNQQGAVGCRFFFGLDLNFTNHIRLIFIAVDSNGKNILTVGGTEAIMLERSWPPD